MAQRLAFPADSFCRKLHEFVVNLHGPIFHVYLRWKNPELASDEGMRIYNSPSVHDSPLAVPDLGGRSHRLPYRPDVALLHYCRFLVSCLIPLLRTPLMLSLFFFRSSILLFATYGHDVSIYDLWNVSSLPRASPVPQRVGAPGSNRQGEAIEAGEKPLEVYTYAGITHYRSRSPPPSRTGTRDDWFNSSPTDIYTTRSRR